jgi:hypothetical protein
VDLGSSKGHKKGKRDAEEGRETDRYRYRSRESKGMHTYCCSIASLSDILSY